MYLILIGMMGSGKSRVGRELAAHLCLPLMDLDVLIEESFTKPITAVFAEYGEAVFRERETEIMLSLATQTKTAVLALGGGSVLSHMGLTALKQVGRVIYLRTSVNTLAGRLSRSRHRSPLVAGAKNLAGRLKEILENRQHLYEGFADVIVDTDGKTPEQVAAVIAAWWKGGQR